MRLITPLIIVIAIITIIINMSKTTKEQITINIPTPTPYQFPYRNPIIPKKQSYRIVVVGDSIVTTLGPNAESLRQNLIKYYPDSEFVTYNYGYPSSNVLSLYNRLQEKILNEGFDLIIIESFGYNPLSEYPLVEGLRKQNEELEKSVQLILSKKPNASLVFMTPIALDPLTYAKGTRDLKPEVRKQWVDERVAYIQNHKKFAEEKGIPVIDVFTASLKKDDTVDSKYISDDYIHPSEKGVQLMSQQIADYIFENKIFPQ